MIAPNARPLAVPTLLLLGLAAAACGDDGAGTGGGSASSGSTVATSSAGTTTSSASTGTGGDDANCATSPQALADCVDPTAYAADLAFVADVRPPGSPHWQAVQDMVAARLTQYGYEVALEDYGTGTNVIGRKPGTTDPERTVVVGAHYDHVEDCPGADDNASGVAATLELARLLAQVELERSVVIAFWDEEELGLIGAQAFVTDLVAAEEDVVVNFTFDTIGYSSSEPNTQSVPDGFGGVFPDATDKVEANDNRGDFVAIITNFAAHDPALAVAAGADRIALPQVVLEIPEGLENVQAFSDLRRSDHAAFWEASYPAVFLTDTANFRNEHYHCFGGPDVVEDIDVDFAVDITRAALEATAIAAGM
jgi:hypothetical protein